MTQSISLPKEGLEKETLLAQMQSYRGDDVPWHDNKAWSLVYHAGDEHTELIKSAYNLFFSENALNPMAFKSLKRFEHEVIRMTAGLFHGDTNVVGTMTAGGTESLLLAVKTYRDMARKTRKIQQPEMILPTTAHVAFIKAAEYFDVKAVLAPVDDSFRVDVSAVEKLINANTILLVGSAPNYPSGIIDPIEDLAQLALSHKLPLHVDACLGGFLLPFFEKLGQPIPRFDFRVSGVTSISADLHKYGYAAKGASTLLYKTMDIMKHQFFVETEWSGGAFASAGLLGTRPGGAIAAAWASMMGMGEAGYLSLAKTTLATTQKLVDGINAISELEILGKPDMSVFAYKSVDPKVNILAVADRLEAQGWHIDRQQKPESLHAMVNPGHANIADQFLSDLKDAVAYVKAHPDMATSGTAATYGMIAKIPFRGMIRENVLQMMMDMYGPKGETLDLNADAQGGDFATKAGVWYLKLKSRFDRLRHRQK